jgi:Secretion system C-terminal sorting domain
MRLLQRVYAWGFMAFMQASAINAQLGTINHDPQNTYSHFLEYDTSQHLLYGTGYHNWNGVDVNSIWRWGSEGFQSLDGGLVNNTAVTWIELHGEDLYMSGTFNQWTNGYDIRRLARWDGESWSVSGEPNDFTSLFKTGEELWCTGSFDTIGVVPITRPARYNGTEWEAFDGTLPATASPFCGALYQGEYYFGGNFTMPFAITEDIIKWDGEEWVSVGGGIPDANYGQVNTMVVYQGKLMVGGIFGSFDEPGYHSMSWDGNSWTPFFPELVTPVGGQVKHMEIIDGKLYQTGRFRFAGPNNLHYAVLMYDGEQLCGIGSMPPDAPAGQAFDICGNADSIFFNTDTRVLSGDSVNYYAVWPVANGPDTCVAIPVGMRESHNARDLRVWPNPVGDELMVEWPSTLSTPLYISVFDALGRRVLRYGNQRKAQGRLQLDVAHLPVGCYYGRTDRGASFRFVKR